jgi:hypothetical protein
MAGGARHPHPGTGRVALGRVGELLLYMLSIRIGWMGTRFGVTVTTTGPVRLAVSASRLDGPRQVLQAFFLWVAIAGASPRRQG